MENTTKTIPLPERDIFYYRQRHKNRVLDQLAEFFADEAERMGITKKDIATKLKKDPSQITRWLSSPRNLTLDTISDLLLALGAEMDHRIVRFSDRPISNYEHPLLAKLRPSSSPTSRPIMRDSGVLPIFAPITGISTIKQSSKTVTVVGGGHV